MISVWVGVFIVCCVSKNTFCIFFQTPTYRSSFSRDESKQKLTNIFSMLGQSVDADAILNLIEQAIQVLKRPEIYQDFDLYKVYNRYKMLKNT